MHQIGLGWDSAPDPLQEIRLQRSPDPLVGGEGVLLTPPQEPHHFSPAVDPSGLDLAVLTHFSFQTLACLHQYSRELLSRRSR